MTKTKKEIAPSQREQFEQAARELGCDDDPAHFDEVLKRVARHKPATEHTSLEAFWDRAKKAAAAEGFEPLRPSFPVSLDE